MDIMMGLSAVSTALQITKDLKDLDVSLNQAEMKAKFPELYASLSDAKIALSDAKLELKAKEEEISDLKLKIDSMASGDICPLCVKGIMKVIASVAHPTLAFAGLQERTLRCDNVKCEHSEKRRHDLERRSKK